MQQEKLRRVAGIGKASSPRTPGDLLLSFVTTGPLALRTLSLALVAAFTVACASAKSPATQQRANDVTPHPLGAFASERIMVLPTRLLRTDDAIGWSATIAIPGAFLAAADSAIEREAKARRVGDSWVFPAALIQSAKRNPTYATDPNVIRAGEAVIRLEREPRGHLAEPVASQLRVLAGLHDARYALVPVEIGFEAAGPGEGRAVLHLALVDIRGSRLEWSGNVRSDPLPALTPAVLSLLATHVADLIDAR